MTTPPRAVAARMLRAFLRAFPDAATVAAEAIRNATSGAMLYGWDVRGKTWQQKDEGDTNDQQ